MKAAIDTLGITDLAQQADDRLVALGQLLGHWLLDDCTTPDYSTAMILPARRTRDFNGHHVLGRVTPLDRLVVSRQC